LEGICQILPRIWLPATNSLYNDNRLLIAKDHELSRILDSPIAASAQLLGKALSTDNALDITDLAADDASIRSRLRQKHLPDPSFALKKFGDIGHAPIFMDPG